MSFPTCQPVVFVIGVFISAVAFRSSHNPATFPCKESPSTWGCWPSKPSHSDVSLNFYYSTSSSSYTYLPQLNPCLYPFSRSLQLTKSPCNLESLSPCLCIIISATFPKTTLVTIDPPSSKSHIGTSFLLYLNLLILPSQCLYKALSFFSSRLNLLSHYFPACFLESYSDSFQ